MTGMQRFVTYIYAYEEGKKSRNVGYAKIEIRGTTGKLEIHMPEMVRRSTLYNVFFVVAQKEKFVRIPIGEFVPGETGGAYQGTFLTEQVAGKTVNFQELCGIAVCDGNGEMYVSFWKETETGEIYEKSFVDYEVQSGKREDVSIENASDIAGKSDIGSKPDITSKSNIESKPEIERNQDRDDVEEEVLHTMEIPMINTFPNYGVEDVWNQFCQTRECVLLGENMPAVKIELSDLRELPKRYWCLGNNSFLLHGFFNYRHLLLGKRSDGRFFLGVPGIYQRQECVIASVFGFTEFVLVEEADTVRQGVWLHILEMECD